MKRIELVVLYTFIFQIVFGLIGLTFKKLYIPMSSILLIVGAFFSIAFFISFILYFTKKESYWSLRNGTYLLNNMNFMERVKTMYGQWNIHEKVLYVLTIILIAVYVLGETVYFVGRLLAGR